MRNYIHVMLCANLFAAQLLFVVGVERTENEVHVCMKQIIVYMLCICLHAFISLISLLYLSPAQAVCSAIAVLLHYMFLVVFMWMLMEGVVLYVALVVVFVKHRMRYIAGFTIASYGQFCTNVYAHVITSLSILLHVIQVFLLSTWLWWYPLVF